MVDLDRGSQVEITAFLEGDCGMTAEAALQAWERWEHVLKMVRDIYQSTGERAIRAHRGLGELGINSETYLAIYREYIRPVILREQLARE